MTGADLAQLRDDLKQDEGLRLKPYFDTVGKITIGYGRNLSDRGITSEQAAQWLDEDIRAAVSDLFTMLPWTQRLDGARQSVLVHMIFNMGLPKLKTFEKFLALVQLGNYQQAAVEMLDSKWADQVGARATRLASVMHSGEVK